jgi:hypothetical protein
MDALVVGDQLFGGIESSESFAIFSLALIDAAERQQRSGLLRIVAQSFAKRMLGFVVLLHSAFVNRADVESLYKTFSIGETKALRFDVSSYNLFNTPQFGYPNIPSIIR